MSNNFIIIKFFAELRDLLGTSQIKSPFNENSASIEEVFDNLCTDYPQFRTIIEGLNIKYSVFINGNKINDLKMTKLQPTDEISILPPVGGG